MKLLLPVLAVLLVGLLVLFISISVSGVAEAPRGEAGLRSDSEIAESLSEELPAAPTPNATPGVTPSQEGVSPPREPIRNSLCFGRIVNEQGLPVADARVSWTRFTSIDLGGEQSWQKDDWGALPRATLSAASDRDGRFSFREAPGGGDEASVLWATRPGYVANGLVLDSEMEKMRGIELTLVSAPAVRVQVLQGGKPLAQARVDHFGLSPLEASRVDGRISLEQARRYLHRSSETDDAGLVELGAFPGEQVLIARHEGHGSLPWRGQPRRTVVLELKSTFQVSGSLDLPTWDLRGYVGERRITVSVRNGHFWDTLASLRNVQGTEWGPVELPLSSEVDRYRVRLEGSPVIPEEVHFESPIGGNDVRVDLSTEVGHRVMLQSLDELENPVPTAVGTVFFKEENGEQNFVQRRADANGYIALYSILPGIVSGEIHAPGYSPDAFTGMTIPMEEEITVLLVLRKAKRLEGRVVYKGNPVSDFEIRFGEPHREDLWHHRSFRRREDGRFELDEVPIGRVELVASTAGLLSYSATSVDTTEENLPPVELVLSDPLVREGSLVDGATQEPVAGARLQLFVSGGIEPAGVWGDPIQLGDDGTFRIGGFIPGENFLRFQADGYGDLFTKCYATEDEKDLGMFSISRPVTIVVAISSAKPRDYTQWRVSSRQGVAELPTRRFSEDGFVSYEGVQAGTYGIAILHPDESEAFILMEAFPGEEALVECFLDGVNLEVDVIPTDERSLKDVHLVYATFRNEQGQRVQWPRPVPADGKVRFEGIDVDELQVTAFDRSFTPLASSSHTEPVGEGFHMTLKLGSQRTTFRVVDADDQPLEGVIVDVSPATGTATTLFGTTDEQGECSIPGTTEGRWSVDLSHPTLGSRYNIAVEGSESIQLVLHAEERIELAVRDGATPLGGVLCRLVAPDGRILGLPLQTDEAGLVSIDAIAEGSYLLRMSHEECWGTTKTVAAGPGLGRQEAQLRRLGDLRITVLDDTDAPLPGVSLQLESVEFQQDVATWVGEGKAVMASTQTDVYGGIDVYSIPNGPYKWTVFKDERFLRGEIHVPALDTAVLELQL